MVAQGARAIRTGPARDDCAIDAFVSEPGKERITCVVRDISERGAKITIDAQYEIGQHFSLLIPIHEDLHETRHCELRWRSSDVLGVRFINSPKA